MAFGPPPSPFTQSQQAAAEHKRGRRRAVFVLVLALVVLAGVGAWFVWPESGAGKGSDAAEMKSAAQPPDAVRESVEALPKGAPSAGHVVSDMQTNTLKGGQKETTPGLWVTKKTMVKGKGDMLFAMKANDPSGKDAVEWHLSFAGDICGVTPQVTVDGRTAVISKDPKRGNSCSELTMVKLDSGKKLWHVGIPTKESTLSDGTTVTMTKGVVTTSWTVGAAGFDMASGKKLWQLGRTKNCMIGGFAGGKALLMRYECAADETYFHYQVKEVDPRSGRARWTYKLANGVEDVSIVSSRPAVLAIGAGDLGATDLISLDSRGKYRATIPLEGGHYEVKCSDEIVDRCSQVAVSGNQVFVTSGEGLEEIADKTNWIVAFDLATGKSGKKFDAGHDQKLYPLRMSGDRLLALKSGTDDAAPLSLVSLDPKTGKQATYFYFSAPQGGVALTYGGELSQIEFENGRVFFGMPDVIGRADKNGIPNLIRIAYGVGTAG